MSDNLVARIRDSLPIETYIGRYVALKKYGKSWKGLCPFHSEKTPSFTVNPEKNMFYCFGCHKGGDIFRFTMDHQSISFTQTLEHLAQLANITITKNQATSSEYNKKKEFFDLNKKVAMAFKEFLMNTDGKKYLNYIKARGINDEVIEQFSLGAVPSRWDFIHKQFPNHIMQMVELGLLQQSQDRQKLYDFFRDRIMFPIQDINGNFIAFGGRIIDSSQSAKGVGKYINSKESKVYHKGEILYGLNFALPFIRKSQCVYLVEGYLDVIGLWQRGIKNVCASLGTAINLKSLKHLQNITEEIVMIFDEDQAGRKAAMSYAKLCMENNITHAKIILLLPGKDPFDIAIQSNLTDPDLEALFAATIPADLFYLLEVLFPQYFTEIMQKNNWDEDPRVFAREVTNYYLLKETHLLPTGIQKREALNRCYQELLQFQETSLIQFYLEETAKILNLRFIDIQKEWDERYAKKNQKLQTSKSSITKIKPVLAYNIPIITDDLQNRSPDEKSDNHSKQLIHLEQNILIEILFNFELLRLNYERLEEFKFTDPSSQILWKYFRSQYLRNESIDSTKFHEFSLPQDILDIFRPLFLEKLQNNDLQNIEGKKHSNSSIENKRNENKNILHDFFLRHEYWVLKASIAKIRELCTIADYTERENLLENENELTNKLNNVKKKLRYANSVM